MRRLIMKEFSREELLNYFAEAFNAARKHISSPGTRDLDPTQWENLYSGCEEEILTEITAGKVNDMNELKKYFEKLSIEWANYAFRSSWQEALDYKRSVRL